MKNFLKYFLFLVWSFLMFYSGTRSSSVDSKIDTIYIHDTVYQEKVYQEKPTKEEPISYSKYKVTDCVLAWGKLKGVINKIRRKESNKDILIYDVLLSPDEKGGQEEAEFYETELSIGECN